MKYLYGARCCRWDLLRQNCWMAGFVSKWTLGHDHCLYRFTCYVQTTLDYCLFSLLSGSPDQWFIDLYSDADLGGCFLTRRSTTGIVAGISSADSPNDWAPLTASSTKMTETADNTPEAEVIAANKANKTEALPLLSLFTTILKRNVKVRHAEDNESTIKMIRKGYSPALRHLPRQYCLSLAHMKDCLL